VVEAGADAWTSVVVFCVTSAIEAAPALSHRATRTRQLLSPNYETGMML
jgi:hypothetical protein